MKELNNIDDIKGVIMKKSIVFSLIVVSCFVLFSLQIKATISESEFIQKSNELETLLTNELSNNNTTVETEINNMKSDYQLIASQGATTNIRNKAQNIVNSLNQLESSPYSITDVQSKARNVITLTLSVFSICEWDLAAELLTYYVNNSSPGIIYVPINWADVENSSDVNNILATNQLSGTGTFSISEDHNLYFAIRQYSFEKSHRYCDAIKITDTYDFDYVEENNSYDKINNWLAAAEELGLYISFGVEIETSGNTEHNFSVQSYDNVSHTLKCSSCNLIFTSAHDCIEIAGTFSCSDCPFVGRNVIIGGDGLNYKKGNEDDENE